MRGVAKKFMPVAVKPATKFESRLVGKIFHQLKALS